MSGYVCHVNEDIPGAVYIGREYRKHGYILDWSPLRNIFSVRSFGRERAIEKYKEMAERNIQVGAYQFIDALIEARDKPLACWCRKSTDDAPACHGDVILELLNTYTDDQLRNFTKENA